MTTFTCTNCKKIIQNTARQPYEIKQLECVGCKKIGLWTLYTGPMAPTMLDNEDKKFDLLKPQVLQAKVELDLAKIAMENAAAARDKIEFKYERLVKVDGEDCKAILKTLFAATDLLTSAAAANAKALEKYERLNDQFTDLGTREAVRKDAPKAFAMANEVQKSGKNKLYIGNRQYVSNHVKNKAMKKLRILDVPNWSPGLNVSWVEGGIAAKAQFKLKLNQGDQYSNIPNSILDQFKESPGMNEDDFYKLCKKEGSGTLLWFDRDGAARPTWTALEIYCLLRAGYRFNFADSAKDGAGRKIVLIPPN